MSLTLTPLDATRGVYRHVETGFVVHDIMSVDEAIAYNGVIAIDAGTGDWAWVAGEDLAIEVYGRNKITLAALATALLSRSHSLLYERVTPEYWGRKSGAPHIGAVTIGGVRTTPVAIGSDLRIFGVATNLQAGRGVSPNRISSTHTVGRAGDEVESFCVNSDLNDPYDTTPGYFDLMTGFDSGANTHSFTPGAGVLGRAIVAIPVGTWGSWLDEYKVSIDNHDQAEVQAKVNTAVELFTANVLPHLYTNPCVRVPIILTTDGKAWVDSNPSASVIKRFNAPATHRVYNPFMSPSLPSEDGWWATNPVLLQPGIAHHQWGSAVDGLDLDQTSTVTGSSPGTSELYTSVCAQLTAIGGVDLLKIMGGFYPRVDTVAIDMPTHSFVNRTFNHHHFDDDPAPIGGQTASQYDASLTATFNAKGFQHERFNWGHWWLAGQPLILATVVLEALLEGKAIRGDTAACCFSGHLCAPMRVKKTDATFHPHTIPSAVAVAATFFKHQHVAMME